MQECRLHSLLPYHPCGNFAHAPNECVKANATGGHGSLISHPDAITGLILEALAFQTGGVS
jgi:hypothetical protein